MRNVLPALMFVAVALTGAVSTNASPTAAGQHAVTHAAKAPSVTKEW